MLRNAGGAYEGNNYERWHYLAEQAARHEALSLLTHENTATPRAERSSTGSPGAVIGASLAPLGGMLRLLRNAARRGRGQSPAWRPLLCTPGVGATCGCRVRRRLARRRRTAWCLAWQSSSASADARAPVGSMRAIRGALAPPALCGSSTESPIRRDAIDPRRRREPVDGALAERRRNPGHVRAQDLLRDADAVASGRRPRPQGLGGGPAG